MYVVRAVCEVQSVVQSLVDASSCGMTGTGDMIMTIMTMVMVSRDVLLQCRNASLADYISPH